MEDSEFEQSLRSLDIRLFSKINSQTTANDKRSLLACQTAARELLDTYTYLEIGSYMGGSLQPYVLDDRCGKIISIDKRPHVAQDARGVDQVYENNSSLAMIENLKTISSTAVEKIDCIDGDVTEIDAASVPAMPQLCFVDGEHTDRAAWNDFNFCFRVMSPNGAVVFHDSMIVYNSLSRIVQHLENEGTVFNAYNLPDAVFVIEIGDFPMHRHPAIADMLINNHVGYLNSLHFNDQYRRFANRPLFRTLRNLRMKLTKANVAR